MRILIGRHSRFICILAFICLLPGAYSQVYINEFQAYNASSYLEKWWGNFPDWIELYNGGEDPVNLSGYYITDDINIPTMWELPSDTIYPGGYLMIYADKVAYKTHTNFSLNGKGDQILLFTPDLLLEDSVSFGIQYPDISYGRYPDGSQNWYFFEDFSPNMENSSNHLPLAIFANEAQFSLEGGFYAGSQSISLTTTSPAAVIRYTLDGSDPFIESPVYNDPLIITSTTVIRAKVFVYGMFSSPTVTQTYILDKDITLPVISISTDGDYLWDDRIGIYVEGTNGIAGNCSDVPVNYNQDWERPVNIEYYDQNGNPGFNQMAGTKIFGACSRTADQKSLSLFARGKYGKQEFEYKLFKDKEIDEFKSFIIRNSGNDIRHTMLRDGMMQTLVKDRMDLDYQEFQPAIIYLNGAYWGILNIREKINEDYLEANHGVDPDSVDLLYQHVYVVEGEDTHFQNMMDFIRSNDMSDPDNYAYVGTQMDINQFLNYYIAQIYYFNQDWPKGNIKYWRPQTPDGRWRWLLYDLDFGFDFLYYSANMVKWATSGTEPSTELFRELVRNDDFHNIFLQRFCSHMNTSFQPGRVIGIIDSLAGNIEAEMPYQIDQWYWPGSMSNWYEELEILTNFATTRLPVLTNNLKVRFNLEGSYELTASVSNPEYGSIQICGVEMPGSITGSYFKNLPITLKAVPSEGYIFYGWDGASSSGNNEIELILSTDASITAHFAPAAPLTSLLFNEFSSNSENAVQDEYGETSDWIELYNTGSEPIQLAGLYLTDSLPDLTKHMVPFDNTGATIVYPDSTIVLYADSDAGQGPLHLNFKLSNAGETIALVQRIGDELIILDSISYISQYAGSTVGRLPDGTGDWQMTLPTAGDLNAELSFITGLYINEFSASNGSIRADEYGEYDDWIEIYNHNDVAVDMGGLFITDTLANATRFRIPTTNSDSTTIPPGGYLLLWADNQPGQGILHLGFGLKRSGEQVGLIQYDGSTYIDSLTYSEQYTNASLSRYPDGKEVWHYLPSTPGAENVYNTLSGLYITEFSASNSSISSDEYGQYGDWIEIYNDNDMAVDIGGVFITDSLNNGMRYRIPTTSSDSTTIPSKGYLLLWADKQPGQGILHLDFGLSRGGEQIGLLQYNGLDFIDSLTFGEQYLNASTSRFMEWDDQWLSVPSTPGSANLYDPVTRIFINEFSSSNLLLLSDSYGEYDDWIELYNDNDVPVDIGGLFITDTLASGTQYRIPTTASDSTTIPARGYIVLWADNQVDQGILHLDFGLTREGEQIRLVQYNGSDFIDTLTYSESMVNTSLSRYPDGDNTWLSMNSTPGTSNIKNEYVRLYINEFRAGDPSVNSTAEYLDGNWIELFNNNEYAIDIGGLYVTDSLPHPDKYRIPDTDPGSTTIPPRGFLLLWTDHQEGQGLLHLNFTLEKSGTQIGLARKVLDRYVYIDTLVSTYQHVSVSTGRVNDGVNSWTNFTDPTPGWSNRYSVNTGTTPSMAEGEFKVYPNPVSNGILHFSHTRSVQLYNQQGILVKVKINANHLDLSSLPAGLYFLKSDQGEVIRVVII